jgi:hypothetical protein
LTVNWSTNYWGRATFSVSHNPPVELSHLRLLLIGGQVSFSQLLDLHNGTALSISGYIYFPKKYYSSEYNIHVSPWVPALSTILWHLLIVQKDELHQITYSSLSKQFLQFYFCQHWVLRVLCSLQLRKKLFSKLNRNMYYMKQLCKP